MNVATVCIGPIGDERDPNPRLDVAAAAAENTNVDEGTTSGLALDRDRTSCGSVTHRRLNSA